MIYSRSAEYAIRACVHLALAPEGRFVMARVIAEREDIPAHFLAKILQELARKGMLKSNKGPSGGFALRIAPEKLRLLDIVEALDGQALADSARQVPWMLGSFQALHSRIMNDLGRSTIHHVAVELSHLREKSRKKRAIPRKS
jgi:Rrf2 family transcriptional regulator, iron-sulfur cluster assembly transcription factor